MSRRTDQIAEAIQKELATILLRHKEEPLFIKATITHVKVSPDLSDAKIFVSTWDDTVIEQIMEVLNENNKFLRHNLARSLNLRITPKLTFIYDDTPAQAQKITNLIQRALASDAEQGKA